MRTAPNPEIRGKKFVPNKYNTNSYRIFGEQDSEQDNVPTRNGYPRPAPFYTDPNMNFASAQVPEPRNDPYAARRMNISQTNIAQSNAPTAGVGRPGSYQREESRWWDWSHSKVEASPPIRKTQDDRIKTRENSYQNIFHYGTEQDTSNQQKNGRYSANPQQIRTLGIVPVTELKSDGLQFGNQNFIEKLSNEQSYNNRNPMNYPRREPQYDDMVMDQPKPLTKPIDRSQFASATKGERQHSMWDLFHPHVDNQENPTNNSRKNQRPPLPEMKRTETVDRTWQNAPYAFDYPNDQDFNQ
ncbi:unnamed protein product [Adineta steineri]|uniref:Uncharacterized protein n=1 Tax=Adineta steineri TaxID=433720 RepID=A0A814MLJ6_9BILA|nr:unnamed protein product [Adineta steineri]CAF1052039.1 unnamed protein product [Adineta steineri]CAF1081417.1 unnamed protein product [Adineta steineri]CAF3502244.1 unnamed protein product [Adineta steineri]CAF3527150.1 unnamed protein product [Adineta steineri]